ncbi:hypothetical protein H8M03_12540 [Sphingomonas sabuli]|uniref:Uncharacterized protein n=1 Tax=Sphingomonas sabuli TaxID=2764186 RepID=A0A7G9L2E2_9SPHN|nr:hypothetical protein [Sphingomonas sabuli]QNM82791.1 hypothetical protein H8M03_12540 [Sphingomonas sabuli]
MTYGLGRGLSVADGPALPAARTAVRTPIRSWRALAADQRLVAVEHALRAATGRIDAFPIAL